MSFFEEKKQTKKGKNKKKNYQTCTDPKHTDP